MLTALFTQLGLDAKETTIYLKLLEFGATRASTLAYHLNLPRTTVQNILLRLEREKLVTKARTKNIFLFSAIHPENLPQIVAVKQREVDAKYNSLREEFQRYTPELLKMMKSYQGIPNVRFFTGREAVRTVLFDTLTSKTELKDFANIDAMFQHVQGINDEYVAEREKTSVTKRSLLLDTPFARQVYESGKYSPKSHKGYKWIPSALYPFSLEMNIYDGKVSYITYAEDDFIGVIIENEHIYKMHESMWKLIWDSLPKTK